MKLTLKIIKISSMTIMSILTLIFVLIQVLTYRIQYEDDLEMTHETWNYILIESNDPKAVIYLFPGGLVEAKAYVPLAMSLSESGFHVIILKSILHLPIINPYQAEKYFNLYEQLPRYALGHSLGGVAASLQIIKAHNAFDGIIYLSSYPSVDLSEIPVKVLSIYGTRDGVLDKSAYVESKRLLPEKTIYKVIAGGNHANFADYGQQRGDLDSCIEKEDQQLITIDWITSFILDET